MNTAATACSHSAAADPSDRLSRKSSPDAPPNDNGEEEYWFWFWWWWWWWWWWWCVVSPRTTAQCAPALTSRLRLRSAPPANESSAAPMAADEEDEEDEEEAEEAEEDKAKGEAEREPARLRTRVQPCRTAEGQGRWRRRPRTMVA